jgi:hypothetical protein
MEVHDRCAVPPRWLEQAMCVLRDLQEGKVSPKEQSVAEAIASIQEFRKRIVYIEPIVSVLLGRRLNIEFLLSRRSQWVWAENKDVMNGAVFPRETDEKGASAVGLFVGFTARPPLRLFAIVDGRRLACTPLNNIDYPSAAV